MAAANGEAAADALFRKFGIAALDPAVGVNGFTMDRWREAREGFGQCDCGGERRVGCLGAADAFEVPGFRGVVTEETDGVTGGAQRGFPGFERVFRDDQGDALEGSGGGVHGAGVGRIRAGRKTDEPPAATHP